MKPLDHGGARDRRPRPGAGLRGVALGLAFGACASPGLPPGGPPDDDAPQLVRITPDSNAVNVRANAIVLHFDEVISERPAGQAGAGAAAGLAGLVILSPSDGRDAVTWRRTAIEIRPRRGLRPNTAYRLTVLPGIADLRSNAIKERREFVFSTGAGFPAGEVHGVVFDWAQARHAPHAPAEVYTVSDTTFRWRTQADSLGRFVLRDLADGQYVLRAWVDGNNNRALDYREPYDSAVVTLTGRADVELYAFVRDTLAPRIESVEPVDSTALRVRFDRVIVGDWDAADAVRLYAADSTLVTLGGTMVPSARFDSLARLARAAADTSRAGADTARAPRAPAAAPDTAIAADVSRDPAARPPEFRRVRPEQQWSIPLTGALEPGAYRLVIVEAPGLNGRATESAREFRIRPPAARPPADTGAADGNRRPARSPAPAARP